MNKYKLEATYLNDSKAEIFTSRWFNTIKEAVTEFDKVYSRKGFKVVIYKMADASQEFEPIFHKFVKKSYR